MLTQRQRSLRLGALVFLFACLAAVTIPLKAANPTGEIAQTVSGGDPSLVEAATSVDQPPSSPPAPAPVSRAVRHSCGRTITKCHYQSHQSSG